jgi:exosortase/archaeosortase
MIRRHVHFTITALACLYYALILVGADILVATIIIFIIVTTHKLFRVSGFEPDPTSIVSPSSFVALPLGAFLRQAVPRATGVAMTCYSTGTPISPLNFASYSSRCVSEVFDTSSFKRRFLEAG